MPVKNITVISTVILGRKNFVAQLMQASSMHKDKKIITYTTEPESAKEFTPAEAEAFIPKIHNPHERVFTVDSIAINTEKRQRILEMEEDIK